MIKILELKLFINTPIISSLRKSRDYPLKYMKKYIYFFLSEVKGEKRNANVQIEVASLSQHNQSLVLSGTAISSLTERNFSLCPNGTP